MSKNLGTIYYTVEARTAALLSAERDVTQSTDKMAGDLKKVEKSADSLNTSMTKLAKSIGAAITVAAIYGELKKAVAVTKEFNATISNLGALTGLAGDDLKKLEDAARRIGATTSLSGTQAAEGMRLIGSQVPALLSSTDALEGVTKSAAVLAEAANTDLPSAAQAIAGAINQFGIAAEETDMVINALAAGAKNGASSVEQTAAAMAVAGTTAKGAGVSFEEFNALVQTLGQGQIFAAEAGTALRNVLLRLDTSVDSNLRPSVVGVGAALRNMEKEVARGTTTYEKFGIVNKTAADVLLQNIDYYEKTVVAVTGTNEAYEQQARNVDNLKGDLLGLSSAYEDLQIALANKLDPALRGFTQTLTGLLQAFGDNEGGISNFERALNAAEVAGASFGAVLATRVAMSLLAATKEFYAKTVAATASAKADVRAAQAAVVSAAKNLMAAQAAHKSAYEINQRAAAARNLELADGQAKAAVDTLNAAQLRLNGTMTIGARVAANLRTGIAMLGGPLGIIAIATAALYTMRDSTVAAKSSLNDLNQSLEETVDKFSKMSKAGQLAELGKLKSEISEVRSETQRLATSLVMDAQIGRQGLFGIGAASGDAKAALEEVRKAAAAASRGAVYDFDAAAESVKNASNMSDKLKNELLATMRQIIENQGKVDGLTSRHGELSDALSQTAAEAAHAATAVDQLTDSLRTGSSAADEYAQKTSRALEDAQDKSAVGKLTRDIRDNAEAWETATKEQLDAAFAVAFATDAYTNQQAALRKATSARNGLTKADREAKQAADAARKGAEDDTKALERLSEQIYQTGLNSKELAQRQAELTMSEYVTPDQLIAVKALAGALHDINEQEKRRKGFGDDVGGKIRGEVDPLSGGMFDDQVARYLAEEEAEEERFRKQIERLREAKELGLEVLGGYQELEAQMAEEHANRMAQIERAKYMTFAKAGEQGFGALADIMKTAQGEQSSAYKAMFVVSKAFSIANAGLALGTALSEAWKLAWPANLAAAATAAGSMATIMSNIQSVSMSGGRQYGGPVGANGLYRINEDGAPEVFNAANGRQYMLPNTRGEVVSNKDATSGSGGVANVTVNIHQNASKAGQVEQREGSDASQIIDIFVADIAGDGRAAGAIERKWGLASVGY